jgi:hypothetical protein
MARTLSGLPLRRMAAWSALLDRVAGLPLHPAALTGGMGYLAALNAAALTRTEQLGLAPWQPPEMTLRSGDGDRGGRALALPPAGPLHVRVHSQQASCTVLMSNKKKLY